jgi:hypothetical protein
MPAKARLAQGRQPNNKLFAALHMPVFPLKHRNLKLIHSRNLAGQFSLDLHKLSGEFF